MGSVVDPSNLTESGERCLRRIAAFAQTPMPEGQLATAVTTAVEVHINRVLGRLIVLSNLQASPFAEAMIAELEDALIRTWESRMSWLARGFGIAVTGRQPYQRFDATIQLRNAIVHGDGQLTDLQQKSLAKLTALKRNLWTALSVQCIGLVPVPTASTHAAIIDVARVFVASFDAEALRIHPAIARL